MEPTPPRAKSRTRAFLLGFALVAPLVSLALIRTNIVLALAPLFLSHALLLYATLLPASQWWGPVITGFNTAAKEVWLTFDDGPSPEHTLGILDLLDRFNARATFFVIGAHAEKYPHLVTEILMRGHAIANHTYTHPSGTFWYAGPSRVDTEIARCSALSRSTPDRPPRLFRAPAGMKSPFLHPALARRGMILVGWTVRGLDTVRRDSARVAERIAKRARPGAIILLHEGHQTRRDPEFAIRCAERTLQRLTASGFAFVIPSPEQLRTTPGDEK